MRVEVDRDLCVGSGNCVQLSGGAIDLDDEGVATVVNGESASVDKLRQAELACPTGAIAVTVDGE